MKESERRLKSLEKKFKAGTVGNLGRLADLIINGGYFDELTEAERETYKAYKESLGGVADDIAGAELEKLMGKPEVEAYHFPLTKRRKPPTPEEYAQRVKEVEAYMQEIVDKYNAPEEKAKREKEYQELQRLGELRREDFYCGRDMDKEHPLPW